MTSKSKRLSPYQRLKEKIKLLKEENESKLNDIKLLIRNEMPTERRAYYQFSFKLQEDVEATLWAGDTTKQPQP